MKTNKKGLDLDALNESLKEKESIDRDLYRALQMAQKHDTEEGKFEVKVVKEKQPGSNRVETTEVLVNTQQNLPTDEEIAEMKAELARQDLLRTREKIRRELVAEQESNKWYRKLFSWCYKMIKFW